MGFRPDPQPSEPTGRFRPDPIATDAGGPRRYSAKNESSYLEDYSRGVRLAGVASDVAAQESSIPSVLQPIAGALESALSLGTGAVAPVPGAIKSALTGQPYTEARNSYVYEPRSEPGKAAMGTVGAVSKPVTDIFGAASGGVSNIAEALGLSPADAEQFGAAVTDIGASAIPARAARAPAVERVVKSAEKPEGRAAIENIRQQGLKLTPKEASQITGDRNYGGRLLQAIGGDAKVSKDIAAANRPVINEMGRKAVGAESLTEAGLKPVKDAGNAVYSEMSSLGKVAPDDTLRGAIEKARGTASKSTKRNTDIDKFVDGVLAEFGDEVDAGQVVNRVRELRRDAANSRKGEGDKRPTIQQEALGEAQRKVADALDDFLELNAAIAGKPELAAKYKENRTRLAKVGTVESTSRAGNLNAKELYKQGKQGAPLSGKLKDVATAHEYAPESTAPVGAETLMEAPGRNLSLTDLLLAAPQAVARHMGVNKLLQSDFYQNMIGGKAGGPHLAEHDTNPNAFPPQAAPEPVAPVPPSVNFEGELGLTQDVPYEALPGNVSQQVQNGRQLAEALGLQLEEAVTPRGAGPNALRNSPDELNFEAVSPEEVGPYRVNTDMPLTDARPLAGVQRGAAMDTGDLQLMPESGPGPYEELPPAPRGKPRQGGATPQPAPRSAPAAPAAETVPPEGLSELGALIDQMLNTKRNPVQQQQAGFQEALGLADEPQFNRAAASSDFDTVGDEPLGQRAGMPAPTRVTAPDGEGYISYIPGVNNSRQITGAYTAPAARGKGSGKANLMHLAEETAKAGETLNSDTSVSAAQLRVYESLRKAGKLEYEYADPEAAATALKEGGKLTGSTPVITNIRPAVDEFADTPKRAYSNQKKRGRALRYHNALKRAERAERGE